MNNLKKKDIAKILAKHLLEYKKQHPNLSGQQIAKKFSVTSSSLNRIENGDVKNPTIDQVIRILEGVGATSDLLGFIDEFYPIISKKYRDYYSTTHLNTNSPELLDKFLQDRDYFRILVLALAGEGIDKEKVIEYFGMNGLNKLNRLVEKGVLPKDSCGVVGKIDYIVNPSVKALKALTLFSIEDCIDLDHDNDYFLSYLSKRVNRKGYDEVCELLKKTKINIDLLMEKRENIGDEVIFYSLCVGHIDPTLKKITVPNLER